MELLIVTGSRADYGPLEWLIKVIREDSFFDLHILNVWSGRCDEVMDYTATHLKESRPDVMMVLGDRYEILGASIAAHLQRVPIAHIGGGDITLGSYDDAMRDCISRLAAIHFATSSAAVARLNALGYRNIHPVGSPGVDYIMYADWKRERPIKEPYVVVSYQAETSDENFGAGESIVRIFYTLPEMKRVFIRPNPDRGSDLVNDIINGYERVADVVYDILPHDEFLNLIYHCEEFIGNSSAMLYEAPFIGVKTRMIGKRQQGRVVPLGDGRASERIVQILKSWTP